MSKVRLSTSRLLAGRRAVEKFLLLKLKMNFANSVKKMSSHLIRNWLCAFLLFAGTRKTACQVRHLLTEYCPRRRFWKFQRPGGINLWSGGNLIYPKGGSLFKEIKLGENKFELKEYPGF